MVSESFSDDDFLLDLYSNIVSWVPGPEEYLRAWCFQHAWALKFWLVDDGHKFDKWS